MANILDYLDWRGDVPFSVDPFNEVDGLILAQFVYLPLEGVVPCDFSVRIMLPGAWERFRAVAGERQVNFEHDPILFEKLSVSRRFRDVQLTGFQCAADADAELQFSALTCILPDETGLVIYRGTDGSVVGWKEDFNLSYCSQTGAQLRAKEYLDSNAGRFPRLLRIGGHSKGGNLAVFAAAFCRPEVQCRITQVLSYDGPGFREEIIASEGYQRIRQRIRSLIPESAVIGMLLNNDLEHCIIKCSVSGIMQHYAYNWEIQRNAFLPAEKLSKSGEVINKVLSGWIAELNDEERKNLVDAVFGILGAPEKETFHEINRSKLSSYPAMLKALGRLSPEQQKLVLDALVKMARNSRDALLAEGGKPVKELKTAEGMA